MRFVTSFLIAALAACTTTPAETIGEESFIPYAGTDGIVEWQVAGEDALYVRALTGGWYLLRTMGRCSTLRTAVSLGFQTSGPDQLDRHGSLIAEGRRCPLFSVTRSDEPPLLARRKN